MLRSSRQSHSFARQQVPCSIPLPQHVHRLRRICLASPSQQPVGDILSGVASAEGALLPSRTFSADPAWQEGVLKWNRPPDVPRVTAPPGAPPIVLLPGFGNKSGDYTEPFGEKNDAIVTNLEERGFRVYVPPIERGDWFKVARALFTLKFWSSSCTCDPGYTWYLERVAATVDKALAETGCSQVDLVGHSAGGWLGRAYLGDSRFFSTPAGATAGTTSAATAASGGSSSSSSSSAASSSNGGGSSKAAASVPQDASSSLRPNPKVRSMVTLGTPQRPPPPEKGRDMTGGAVRWVDTTYPGAFFKPQGVRYVTVSGRTVRGHREFPRPRKGPRVPQEYAHDSYEQVCGDGEGIEGDCVVPLTSSCLEGAEQVLLDGCYHSMSKIGTFDDASGVVWYGSDAVIDCWLHHLVDEQAAGARQQAAAPEEKKIVLAAAV